MLKEIHCVVKGRVQGVMYRDFAQRKARALQLVGFVENGEDGSVSIVAQGVESNLVKYIEYLHKGSFLAKVADVRIEWMEPKSTFSDFGIRY